MAGARTTVLLVDDHQVVRAGFRRLIEQVPSFEVVGEAGNGQDAYRMLSEQPVDLVVMDISLPGFSGLEVIRRLRAHGDRTRVLVLSVHESPGVVQRAFTAGANGYLGKSGAADELVTALRAVASGQRYLSGEIARQLATMALEMRPGSGPESLTAREFEVLRLFVAGAAIDEMASALHLSPKTVANNLSGIKLKLGARSHADLMRLAIEHGVGFPAAE